ncbi:MAG: RecX family transcriptional regulator [Flavobacteriaceae bacterium]|nr:RecX family transcriptional regulator [Flavobacteriaceae bacterium]
MKTTKTYTVNEAKQALEHYCAYQERCHIEVLAKLNNMGMIPQAQEIIILHLLKENYLNEERFAKSYARGKFLIKNYGRIRIERGLKQKQISAYLINKALQEIEEQKYLETLNILLEKKEASISESNPYKKKKKIVDFLLRKGYEYALIEASIRKYIKI